MSLGSHGTKLCFTSTEPKDIHRNSRISCFDPYWSRVSYSTKLKTNNIYFTFDYLHIDIEKLMNEMNKVFSEVLTIELLGKEVKKAYSYKDSYGDVGNLGNIPESLKGKAKPFTCIKGFFKITFKDWILVNNEYRKKARVLGYLVHHMLCTFSVSEHWLKSTEYKKIVLSKYKGVNDYLGFVVWLTNNRNKRSNRRLTTSKNLTRRNLTNLGSKKRIDYIVKYPKLFPTGKQTLSLKTFNQTIKDMEEKISLIKKMKEIAEKTFGKPGEFCLLEFNKDNYNGTIGKTYQLVLITAFNDASNTVFYELICDKMGTFISSGGTNPTGNIPIKTSAIQKNKKGELEYKLPASANSRIRGAVKINKEIDKKSKEVLDSFYEKILKQEESMEKQVKNAKTNLDKAVKAFDACTPIKSIRNPHDRNKYNDYTRKRSNFFTNKKTFDTYEFSYSMVKYYSKMVKEVVSE